MRLILSGAKFDKMIWTIYILFTSALVWGSHTDDECSRSGRTIVV